MCCWNSSLIFVKSGLGVIHFVFILSPLGMRFLLVQADRKLLWVDKLMGTCQPNIHASFTDVTLV